jgi:hypothetical protein
MGLSTAAGFDYSARPGENSTVHSLHNQSRQINEVHLTIALIAAIIICLPEKPQGDCKT